MAPRTTTEREPRAKYCLVCDCKVDHQRVGSVRDRSKLLQTFVDCMSLNTEKFKGDLNAANCFCVKCAVILKEWDSGRELILQITARGEQLKATMAMNVLNTQIRTKGRTRSTATEKLRDLIRQQYNVRVRLNRGLVSEKSKERQTDPVERVLVPESKDSDEPEHGDLRPRKRLRTESLTGLETNGTLGPTAAAVEPEIDIESSEHEEIPARTEAEDLSTPNSQPGGDCFDDIERCTTDETDCPDIRIVDLSKICLSDEDEEPMETDAPESAEEPLESQTAAPNPSPLIPTWVLKPVLASAVAESNATENANRSLSTGVTQAKQRSPAFKPQFADPNVIQTGPDSFSYARLVPFFLAEGRYICGICPSSASSLMITNSEILSHIRTKHGHIFPPSVFRDYQDVSSAVVTSVPFAQVLQGSLSTETSSSNIASHVTSNIPPISHKEIKELSPGHYSYYGRKFTYSDGKYFCGLCPKCWFAVIGAVDLITLHMRTSHANLLSVGQAQPQTQANLRVVRLLRPQDVELLKSKSHRIIGSRILSQPQQTTVPSAPTKLLSNSLVVKETRPVRREELTKSQPQQKLASVHVTTTTRDVPQAPEESCDEIQIVDENNEKDAAANLPEAPSSQFECVFCHKRFDNTTMFCIHVQSHQIVREVVKENL